MKDFVNKLEEDKSVAMRRGSNNYGQFTHNNMQNQGNYQQQSIIRQNVLNVSSSMRLESGNTTPTRQLSPLSHMNNNNKTPKQFAQNNQFTINENFAN